MSVHKEKTGKYRAVIKYKDYEGNIKCTSKRGFSRKQDALKYEINFINKAKDESSYVFERFVKEIYLKDLKLNVKITTYLTKISVLKNHIFPVFKNEKLSNITPATVRTWQNSLKAKNYSIAMLKKCQKTLSSIFNYAVRFYSLPENPVRKAGEIGSDNNKKYTIWKKEDFDNFLNNITDKTYEKYFVLYSVLYFTGMRIGEALALTKIDIDFNKNEITINKSFQKIQGKEYITSPKTESSNRVISINQGLSALIKDYIEKKLYNPNDHDRIFPYTQSYVGNNFRSELKRINVPYIRIHDLRHSHASLLMELGENPLLIAERLGHKSVKMTLDIYSHLSPNKQKDLAVKLDKL